MNRTAKDIPLARLDRIEKLSRRAYYICLDNKFDRVSLLIEYFRENGTFLKLRKCGEMVNTELKNICGKYDCLFPGPPEPEIIPENKFENLCRSLSGHSLFICSVFFDILFRDLTVRSRNALLRLSENKMDLNSYFELVVKPNHKFKNIPNVGIIGSEELSIFHDRLLAFLQNIKNPGNNYSELLAQYVKVYLETKFNVDLPDNSAILTITKEKRFIPVFKIIEYLIDNNRLFSWKHDLFLFKHYFSYVPNTDFKPSREISEILNISSRAVKNQVWMFSSNFSGFFSFIKDLPFENRPYNDYFTNDFIHIDDYVVKYINDLENVNYSQLFYLKIFGLILSESHELLSFKIKNQKRNMHRGEDCKHYLVHKRLLERFDFEGFFKDVWNKRNSIKYIFFKVSWYLTGFYLKKEKSNDKKIINHICETLLLEVFGRECRVGSYIYIGRNNFTVISEKEAEIILGIDASVTDYRNIKRCTIRYIVKELLRNVNKPLHIGLIALHVCMYINTTEENIYLNLKRDKKTFLLCGEGYIALRMKMKPA